MNNYQRYVKEFHVKYNHPISNIVKPLNQNGVETRSRWMKEEIQEFEDANNLVDQVDALCDLLYFAFGCAIEMGVDLGVPFQIVHQSNMSKPVNKFDSDGKIQKDGGFTSPTKMLETELLFQSRLKFKLLTNSDIDKQFQYKGKDNDREE